MEKKPKKVVGGGYKFFMDSHTVEEKEKIKEESKKSGGSLKYFSTKWKEMKDEGQEPYIKEYKEFMEQYEIDIEKWYEENPEDKKKMEEEKKNKTKKSKEER